MQGALSEIQRRIWDYVATIARGCRHVFPSHAKIAASVGCCRDTVIEAMKKFRSLGWLASIKRCYRSSVYFLKECLVQLDTKNIDRYIRPLPPDEISREKPTGGPTLYSVLSILNKYIYTKMEDFEKKVFEKREVRAFKSIPDCIKLDCLSERDRQILANNYSEAELVYAKEQTEFWMKKKKRRPGNIAAFMTMIIKNKRAKRT
jgi:DNA-binding transcriptional MocR family regulator